MADITAGNMYEINQSLMENEPKMGKPMIAKKTKDLGKYITETKNKYYMLLCKEIADYTILHLNGCEKETPQDVVIECLQNRGTLYAIDKNPDTGGIECWIRSNTDDIMRMYAFFPYDAAIVEVK